MNHDQYKFAQKINSADFYFQFISITSYINMPTLPTFCITVCGKLDCME